MKQVLCAHFPRWPIDRLNRRLQPAPMHEAPTARIRSIENRKSKIENPLVLIHTTASRQFIACASPGALQRGVRPGMPLAEARALCPQLRHHPYEPQKDLRALQALARWMIRFSPIVGLQASAPDADEYLPAIFLDVSGSERLYGGWMNLLEQVAESLEALHLHAALAIAPTVGAAFAVASASGRSGLVVQPDRLRETLSPLPVTALRIDPKTAEALHHLGLVSIAHLLAIPRAQLPARFGPGLLLRLDQALGNLSEPVTPLSPQNPVRAKIEFDGVTDALETITRAIELLAGRICDELARRGAGARRLVLGFHRLHAAPIHREVLLSRPSRRPENLFNLLRCALEMLELDARNRLARRLRRNQSRLAHLATGESIEDEGFSAISLEVPLFEPLSDEQFAFDNQGRQNGRIEAARLVERLTLRLGEQAVTHAEPVERHLPEQAFALRTGMNGEEERPSDGATERRRGRQRHEGIEARRHEGEDTGGKAIAGVTRPLLLQFPREIQVMVAPSHDREGRPISFSLDGKVRRVVHAAGPERIAGLWWENHFKTRDYFAVEDEQAQRWWLFRVRESHRWFLHGQFA